jgi:microcystin-dependent protein
MASVGQAYFSANPFEFDENGVPLAGGQLYSYVYGTTTPLSTYQDPALTIPNANPIVLDANGRAGSVWLGTTQAYQFVLFTAATPDNPSGSQIWSRGPFGPAAGGSPASSAGIIGEVRDFAGPAASIPALWYPCFGQAVSRTTYSALFAVIGTTWGAGDLSTTFNLPDLRGRATFGVDNMGGVAAGRVTSGVSGIAGSTLGAVGGSQYAQLDAATAASASTVTDPGHYHTLGTPSGDGATIGGTRALVGASTTDDPTSTVTTGITVATKTTITSALTGTSENMPPAAMTIKMIYAGA